MTKKTTFCAMMAVLAILCLMVSNVLQANTIFLYLFSTLFTYICTEEHGIKYGILTYAVISLVGFMIVADKVSIIAYIIIVGYYPVIKHIIDHLGTNKYIKWLLKIIFAVAVATVALLILKAYLPSDMNLFFLYPIGVAVFIIYDIALTMGIKFYVLRLRKFK